MDYSVFVEARAPVGEPPLTYADDLYDDEIIADLSDRLMDCIQAHHGSGGVGARTWDAIISVDADDIETAAATAVRILADCSRGVGLPAWPVTRLEVTSEPAEAT